MKDVLDARERIAPHLARTPVREYPSLSRLVGTTVVVKHENHLPTGAFKVRGGVNLLARMPASERERGIVCASTGNHGQSLAFASRLFGARTIVCVPQLANAVKLRAIEDLGGEIVRHGRDFDEAREHCEAIAAREGHRYVHSGDEPDLIAGVATATLELLEDRPDVTTILVPVGGGSGAAAACIAAQGRTVIGVQSDAAPAAWRSWKERRLVEDRMATFAEGLATRTAFALPQAILRAHLSDFVLVSDEDIRRSCVAMIDHTRNLVEPAAAAPLAAALQLRSRLHGQIVALVCTGGNITLGQLGELLG